MLVYVYALIRSRLETTQYVSEIFVLSGPRYIIYYLYKDNFLFEKYIDRYLIIKV